MKIQIFKDTDQNQNFANLQIQVNEFIEKHGVLVSKVETHKEGINMHAVISYEMDLAATAVLPRESVVESPIS